MSKDLLLKVFKTAKQKQLIDEDFIIFLENIFPEKSNDVTEVMKRPMHYLNLLKMIKGVSGWD